MGILDRYNLLSELRQIYSELLPDARRVFFAEGDFFYCTDVNLPYTYKNEYFYAQRIKSNGSIDDSKIYLIKYVFEYTIDEEGYCEYEGDWQEIDSIEDWEPSLNNIIRSFTKKDNFVGTSVCSTTYHMLTEANTLRVLTHYIVDKLTEEEFFSRKGLTMKGGEE